MKNRQALSIPHNTKELLEINTPRYPDFPQFQNTQGELEDIPIAVHEDSVKIYKDANVGLGLPALFVADKTNSESGFKIHFIYSISAELHAELQQYSYQLNDKHSTKDRKFSDIPSQYSKYFYEDEGGHPILYALVERKRGASGSGIVHSEFFQLFRLRYYPKDYLHIAERLIVIGGGIYLPYINTEKNILIIGSIRYRSAVFNPLFWEFRNPIINYLHRYFFKVLETDDTNFETFVADFLAKRAKSSSPRELQALWKMTRILPLHVIEPFEKVLHHFVLNNVPLAYEKQYPHDYKQIYKFEVITADMRDTPSQKILEFWKSQSGNSLKKTISDGLSQTLYFCAAMPRDFFDISRNPADNMTEQYSHLHPIQTLIDVLKSNSIPQQEQMKSPLDKTFGLNRRTALMNAAICGFVPGINHLLRNGATIELNDATNKNALMLAIEKNHYEAALLMLAEIQSYEGLVKLTDGKRYLNEVNSNDYFLRMTSLVFYVLSITKQYRMLLDQEPDFMKILGDSMLQKAMQIFIDTLHEAVAGLIFKFPESNVILNWLGEIRFLNDDTHHHRNVLRPLFVYDRYKNESPITAILQKIIGTEKYYPQILQLVSSFKNAIHDNNDKDVVISQRQTLTSEQAIWDSPPVQTSLLSGAFNLLRNSIVGAGNLTFQLQNALHGHLNQPATMTQTLTTNATSTANSSSACISTSSSSSNINTTSMTALNLFNHGRSANTDHELRCKLHENFMSGYKK